MRKQHEVQKQASAREAVRAAPYTASSIENSAVILHYMDSGVLCPVSLYSASQMRSMDKERWCLVSTFSYGMGCQLAIFQFAITRF